MADKVTLEDLEAILNSPDGKYQIEILPNGEVTAVETAGCQCGSLRAENARLLALLKEARPCIEARREWLRARGYGTGGETRLLADIDAEIESEGK